ncbi:AlwI family type II restriction endonuclease [Bacillus sp. NEB1478]|uniref:AlwI family type II restriction endonuclease n=1 Tax=Bacillus sp. NEB1478 TaxID=3073816 RepID=UPI002873B039|nr:AlwI family type II restriction endonuclease [Bacillus sp. NEB1478]WNB93426.1 AlwI family type II restriction endonuclease [Bacillus sp. NEB1478]
MINNWHVPRNKRKLYPIVPSLSAFSLQNLGDIWVKDLNRQLDFEEILEEKGLKRKGVRRDQRGGGARTYEAWVSSLGLTFEESESNKTRLTMIGEALVNGEPPVPLMTKQLMQFQYPSPYSLRSRVQINERFKIRPFRFLIKLLLDDRLAKGSKMNTPYLTKSEIGCIISVEAENESDACYEHIVDRILEFRKYKYDSLPQGFEVNVPSTNTGIRTRAATIKALEDNANTFINYLEFTQLIVRDDPRKPIYIPDPRIDEANAFINDGTSLKPLNQKNKYWKENFQRNFGLLPGKNRDNRRFEDDKVTENIIVERIVLNEFLTIARKNPISEITEDLIHTVSKQTGIPLVQVEDILDHFRVDTFSLFETNYVDMAHSGRELAAEFEHATLDVFRELGFQTWHVGTQPRHPDVLVESPMNFAGIIDNKAYHVFSITHDYELKMINSYIPTFQKNHPNLSFFMYIAGGFGKNFDQQAQKIAQLTGVNGCGIRAADLMRLLRKHKQQPIHHQKLKNLFECNKVVKTKDIQAF